MKHNHAIGGQAVIEGVMMKAKRGWSVAVRDPRGEIQIRNEPLRPLPRIFSIPFIRGVITLLHTLTIGIQALEFSAQKAYDEGEDEKPLSKFSIAMSMALAFGLGALLFIVFPLYAAKLVGMVYEPVATGSVLFNLVDGVVRVAVFLLYVFVIGLWAEMRRVFEYHGAEHKVIHAYEAGLPLEVQHVRPFSPRHPRCGTSFLMIVMVLSIIVFSVIPQAWPFVLKALARVVLIPVIAGISYETLKFSARMKDNPIVRIMILPGILLQHLTTYEPDDKQIEVALTALKEVLKLDSEGTSAEDASAEGASCKANCGESDV